MTDQRRVHFCPIDDVTTVPTTDIKQETEAKGFGGEAEDEESTQEQLHIGGQVLWPGASATKSRSSHTRRKQSPDSRICILTASKNVKRELKQLNLSFVFFKRKFVWSEFKTFYFLLCIQNDIFFEHLLVVADFDDFKLKILVVRKRKKPFNVCSYKTCRKLKCILVCRLKGI